MLGHYDDVFLYVLEKPAAAATSSARRRSGQKANNMLDAENKRNEVMCVFFGAVFGTVFFNL
jgi:hypothetical protein